MCLHKQKTWDSIVQTNCSKDKTINNLLKAEGIGTCYRTNDMRWCAQEKKKTYNFELTIFDIIGVRQSHWVCVLFYVKWMLNRAKLADRDPSYIISCY